jgi:hypothetical protein
MLFCHPQLPEMHFGWHCMCYKVLMPQTVMKRKCLDSFNDILLPTIA